MDASGWAYQILDLRISAPALVSNIVLPDKMGRLFQRPTFRPHQFRAYKFTTGPGSKEEGLNYLGYFLMRVYPGFLSILSS